MNPEYSNYDGTPHVDERDHWHFYSDAYRTAGNIGLDCLWNGVVPELCDANARLQRFFLEHDRTCVYAVDGTPVDETVLHRSVSSPLLPRGRSLRCTRRSRTRSTTRSAGYACCGTPRSAPARVATTTTSSTPSRSSRSRESTACGDGARLSYGPAMMGEPLPAGSDRRGGGDVLLDSGCPCSSIMP